MLEDISNRFQISNITETLSVEMQLQLLKTVKYLIYPTYKAGFSSRAVFIWSVT